MSSTGNPVVPWQDGTDLVDHGQVAGIHWATMAAPSFGAVNGYILVPPSHPWHGRDYDEVDGDAPGGFTYSKAGPDGGTWFGFDTLHFGDVWPGMPLWDRDPQGEWTTHWTPELVAEEARRVARYAAEVANNTIDGEVVEYELRQLLAGGDAT